MALRFVCSGSARRRALCFAFACWAVVALQAVAGAAEDFALRSLTEARHEIDTARSLSRLYLAGQPLMDELDQKSQPAEEHLVGLQSLAARPRPYHFVIRPAIEDPKRPRE